jgi:hypothetical protein
VPRTWCVSCHPFGEAGNIYTGLLTDALAYTVVNESRRDVPRLIIVNTGSVRFDLPQGPFTRDDGFIVSPYPDAFQFLPDVPYASASRVLAALNAGPDQKRRKRHLERADFGFASMLGQNVGEPCENPATQGLSRRSLAPHVPMARRRMAVMPGYVTRDDFGDEGDDTKHATVPYYKQPLGFQANASFPVEGSLPETVDLIFLDFIAPGVLAVLATLGAKYKPENVQLYMPENFTTNSYLPLYAKAKWPAGLANCPIGNGIGS